ncbi:hypothetical protein [Cellulomonas alba]|uniref:Uncharacterized protein n=1 Tax=Cellulomonas alba TaxID=3053467 RepID=A0ABT7SI44_9CELL|nr:hypothetical protein [Cellulomonas alba]MDM7855811.1 hypothetical protein [Cellulomonas alba]
MKDPVQPTIGPLAFQDAPVPVDDPNQWLRAASRTLRHLARCPHLSDTTTFVVVSAAELDRYEVCQWCADEAAGVGRKYFTNLEDALEAFHMPLENRRRAREVAAAHRHDKIWTNGARTYIALALGDGGMLAQLGKSWIWTWDNGRELLPNHTSSRSSTTRSADQRAASVCPTCSVQLPATGICDTCG